MVRFGLDLNGRVGAWLVFAGLFIAVGWLIVLRDAGPYTYDWGTVVRIASGPEGYGDHIVLIVETSDGTEHAVHSTVLEIRNCVEGSRIGLIRGRATLRTSPDGCLPGK